MIGALILYYVLVSLDIFIKEGGNISKYKEIFLQVGELLYCRNRGATSCCFVDEKCGRDYVAINDEMTQQAVDFMQKPERFLFNLVVNAGYESCHRTKGSL